MWMPAHHITRTCPCPSFERGNIAISPSIQPVSCAKRLIVHGNPVVVLGNRLLCPGVVSGTNSHKLVTLLEVAQIVA